MTLRDLLATAGLVWRPYIYAGYVIALGTLGFYAVSIVRRTRRVSRRLGGLEPAASPPPPREQDAARERDAAPEQEAVPEQDVAPEPDAAPETEETAVNGVRA